MQSKACKRAHEPAPSSHTHRKCPPHTQPTRTHRTHAHKHTHAQTHAHTHPDPLPHARATSRRFRIRMLHVARCILPVQRPPSTGAARSGKFGAKRGFGGAGDKFSFRPKLPQVPLCFRRKSGAERIAAAPVSPRAARPRMPHATYTMQHSRLVQRSTAQRSTVLPTVLCCALLPSDAAPCSMVRAAPIMQPNVQQAIDAVRMQEATRSVASCHCCRSRSSSASLRWNAIGERRSQRRSRPVRVSPRVVCCMSFVACCMPCVALFDCCWLTSLRHASHRLLYFASLHRAALPWRTSAAWWTIACRVLSGAAVGADDADQRAAVAQARV